MQEKAVLKMKSSDKDYVWFMLRKLPAKWFRELNQVDLRAVYKRISQPTLVIGGGKDVQCSPSDVGEIKVLISLGPVETKVVPDLTLLLLLQLSPQ